MGKIRISVEKMSISVDTENAEYLFTKFSNELFCACIGKEKTKRIVKELEECKNQKITKEQNTESTGKTEVEDESQIKCKGFIYWKCRDCGETRGFCLKKESKGIHCINCGSDHLFKEPLKPLYAQCECGKSFRYLTNMEEEIFDLPCLECGSPMSVKWNEKKKIYESMN